MSFKIQREQHSRCANEAGLANRAFIGAHGVNLDSKQSRDANPTSDVHQRFANYAQNALRSVAGTSFVLCGSVYKETGA